MLWSMAAMAAPATFVSDGITYCVTDSLSRTVEVTAASAHQQLTEAVIPAVVSDGDTEWRVTGVGEGAFYMSALQRIELPEGLTHVDRMAFRYSALSQVNLPQTLTTIGYGAFGETLLRGVLEIPDAVTEIGPYAFTYTDITALRLGQSVQEIGAQAFWDCYYLTDVGNLPASLTVIGDGAFDNCGITSVEIPGSVRHIGKHAFCNSLQEVVLHEGLETIGEGAFANTNLAAAEIPASVRSVGYGVFSATPRLTAIGVAAGNSHYKALDGILYNIHADSLICCPGGKTDEVCLPSSVRVVYLYAFCGCSKLTTVVLNDGLKEVRGSAFDGCTALDSIRVPQSIEFWSADVRSTAWYGRQPNGLVYLGPVVMGKNCTESTLNVRPGTRCIAACAFQDCGAKKVILPRGLVTIGDYAFASSNITSLRVPATVKNIGSSAFNHCGLLKRINFPKGLERMGSFTLATCQKLGSLVSYCPEPPKPIDWYHYTFGDGTCTLYCPVGSKEAYEHYYSKAFVVKEVGPLGDLNNDNVTDVDDLNRIINIVLGRVAKPMQIYLDYYLLDLDGDSKIDIDDVNELLNIMIERE